MITTIHRYQIRGSMPAVALPQRKRKNLQHQTDECTLSPTSIKAGCWSEYRPIQAVIRSLSQGCEPFRWRHSQRALLISSALTLSRKGLMPGGVGLSPIRRK